jgi:signal transduction histidine kinase
VPGKSSSVLAPTQLSEVAGVLSEQLLAFLGRLAATVQPESGRLEVRFLNRLEELGFEPRQRGALVYLTAGAAARVLGSGGTPAQFLEQVEYHGRRLAKLNLTPTDIVIALREYDNLLTPLLKRKDPKESANFQWVREQLQFFVMLALNNSYYQVREEETQAFYEMFWAELESDGLDSLLDRFLSILARFSRADAAHWYLVDRKSGEIVRRASLNWDSIDGGTINLDPPKAILLGELPECLLGARSGGFDHSGTGESFVLDQSWPTRYRSFWSIPLIGDGKLAGVIQFAFAKNYDWLPREQDLLTAASERCLKAVEKTQLVMDLAERERQIRLLAERMMQVEEVERRRISRELHDQTGQDLLCIRLQMEMLEGQLPDSLKDCKSRLGEVRDLTERTILEIRRLIAALSPAVLEQLGLAAALRQLVNRHRQMHSWRVKLQIGRVGTMPKQLEVIVYRLVQECFNNIAKHSRCSGVNISLRSADGILRLLVEDDGVGFDVAEAFQKKGSFGLAGIRERVTLLGGRCEITSRQRKSAGKSKRAATGAKSGTKIRIELPMPQNSEWGRPLNPGSFAAPGRRGDHKTAEDSSSGKGAFRKRVPEAELA